MELQMREATEAMIEDAIAKAKNRTTSQRFKSWIKTEVRTGLNIQLNNKRTVAAVGSMVLKQLMGALSNVPVVGKALAKGATIASDVGSAKLQQKLADQFVEEKMKEWSAAKVETDDLAQFTQDVSNRPYKDAFPKLVDAIYKIQGARNDVFTKAQALERIVKNGTAKPKDVLSKLEKLAYAYGYYMHRLNRLQLYADSIFAYISQVQEALDVYRSDIGGLGEHITLSIDTVLADIANAGKLESAA